MSNMSYESAMSRLEEIVKKLESGDSALEETVKLYDEGLKLSAFCDKKLTDAKQKIVSIENYLKEATEHDERDH
mgnify:CR=1 FL=1